MATKSNVDQNLLTPTQIQCLTKFSREGQIDMENKKPYRTKSQKENAKQQARKDDDGTYRSTAPVSYHNTRKKREYNNSEA